MRYNNNKYSVIKKAMHSMAAVEGFDLNVSTDGEWGIGDRGPNVEPADCCATTVPSYAPQAVKDFMATNGYLDHKHALLLVGVVASSDGASDGWSAPVAE